MAIIARPKEGPRAPLFYWAPVILIAGAVQAQTVDMADLEACSRLETDERKLACFEAVVVNSRSTAEPVPEPPAAAAPATEPVVAPGAVADAEPVEQTGSPVSASALPEPPPESTAPTAVVADTVEAAPPAASEPARERSAAAEPPPSPTPAAPSGPPAQAAAAAPPTPEASAPAVADAPGATADDFGREHLGRSDESGEQTLSATVVEVTKTGYGELVFHLDNGQVWRQQEKRYYPYPRNREFDVTISRGILGEYQLQVGGTGRKVTIRRIR